MSLVEEDFGHLDDDGEPCDCDSQECAYDLEDTEDNVRCPNCGSKEMSLVHGDHGYRCDKCKATFTCP